MNQFFTKVVGVTFNDRQEFISDLVVGQTLQAVRQPNNPYDRNAIAVFDGVRQIGFLSKDIARQLAPEMDAGVVVILYVTAITGQEKEINGVNIRVDMYTKDDVFIPEQQTFSGSKESDERYRSHFMTEEGQKYLINRLREERIAEQHKNEFVEMLRQNIKLN